MAETEYRYIGDHADFVRKGDKEIPLAPGDFVKLSEEDAETSGLALLKVTGKGKDA